MPSIATKNKDRNKIAKSELKRLKKQYYATDDETERAKLLVDIHKNESILNEKILPF